MAEDRQQTLEAALDSALAGTSEGRVDALAVNPCELWYRIRDEVKIVIKILEKVGVFFPWARKAAELLKVLAGLLDKLCPIK